MKISSKGSSKYLAKGDVPNPILATIADIKIETLQNPREDKPVLHFAGTALKPMVLNVTNRRVLIAAYGDETDAWRGQRVEIYVNLDVTNSNGEIVGGIRVRIPAAAPIVNGTRPAAPKPAPPTPPPLTLDDKHAQALAGIAQADTIANLDAWAKWAKGIPFDDRQEDDLADSYHRRKEQLTAAPAGRRAATSRA